MLCPECGCQFTPDSDDEHACHACHLESLRPDPDGCDDFGPPCCQVCGAYTEWVDCWNGCDEGYFDEWETDPINFAEGEELYPCHVCNGIGGWQECTALPHTDEQLAEHRRRKGEADGP